MNAINYNSTSTLHAMAESLKVEVSELQESNRAEAMRLLKLYVEVTNELFRRERLKANAYKFN